MTAAPGMPAQDRYPFWTWEDLAILTGMVLPSLVIAGTVVRLGGQLAPSLFNSSAMKLLPFQALVYVLLFATLWGLLRLRYDRPFWRSLSWNFLFSRAWVSLALGPVIALLISTIGVMIKAPVVTTPFEAFLADRTSLAVFLFFAVLLGPLCEELAFRGFVFPLIARDLGAWTAVILSALPFALLHGPQYQWSWQHILLVFLAGVVFGWIRAVSGSTAAATLAHGTYNLTFFIGFIALRS